MLESISEYVTKSDGAADALGDIVAERVSPGEVVSDGPADALAVFVEIHGMQDDAPGS